MNACGVGFRRRSAKRFARAAALLLTGASAGVLANPCPPFPTQPPPPYALLTGSVTVTTDSIAAGPQNTCGISGGSLTVAGTLTNNGMLLITPGGGSFGVLHGGVFANVGGASFTAVAGSISNDGTITNSASFEPTAPLTNTGSINNLTGGLFIEVGAMTSSGSISNDADFRITQATGFSASLDNSGAVSNSASGTFSIINGALLTNSGVIDSAGTFHNTGSVTNALAGSMTSSGTFVNGSPTGVPSSVFANAGALLNTGAGASFSNSSGSTLSNTGTLRNDGGASLMNFGTLSDSGGTLTNTGSGSTLTNGGALQILANGEIDNLGGATLNNEANFNIVSGTLNNGGTLNNDTLGSINNSG